jgi:hypothetical protein
MKIYLNRKFTENLALLGNLIIKCIVEGPQLIWQAIRSIWEWITNLLPEELVWVISIIATVAFILVTVVNMTGGMEASPHKVIKTRKSSPCADLAVSKAASAADRPLRESELSTIERTCAATGDLK